MRSFIIVRKSSWLLLLLLASTAGAEPAFRPRTSIAATTSTSRAITNKSSTSSEAASPLGIVVAPSGDQESNKDPRPQPSVVRGGAADVVVASRSTLPNAIAGTVAFAAFQKLVQRGLAEADIKFPAQLGACMALFVALCLLDLIQPSTAGAIFDALTPGTALLAKWFPVFFVPGLVLLPLSPSIPGTVDVSSAAGWLAAAVSWLRLWKYI